MASASRRAGPAGGAFIEPVFGEQRAWQESGPVYEELRKPDYYALAASRRETRAANEWSPSFIWLDQGFVRVEGDRIPAPWATAAERVLVFRQAADVEPLLPLALQADVVALEGIVPDAWDRILRGTGQPLAFELKASTLDAFERIAERAIRVTSAVTTVNDRALRVLGKASGLVSLDLRFAAGLTDAGFDFAKSFERLGVLAVPGSFRGSGLKKLAPSAPLRTLHRPGMDVEDGPNDLGAFAACNGLEELELAVYRPENAALADLGSLEKLQVLSLTVGSDRSVRVDFVRKLRHLRKLTLSIEILDDTRELADALSALEQLEELSLIAPIDDRIPRALRRHRRLRCIRLAPPLELGKPKPLALTRSGVADLACIASLRALRVRGAKLDDGSLELLSGLRELASLSLGGSFGADGIRRLADLPRLRLLDLVSINLDAARALASLHRKGWDLAQLRFGRAPANARASLRRAFGKGMQDYGHESLWNSPRAFPAASVLPG